MSFGKLLKFNLNQNKVIIEFENGKGIIEVITPRIINIFSPIKYQEHYSRAIEELKVEDVKFTAGIKENYLEIVTEKLKVLIYDEYKVDFYDIDGKILCEDYRASRDPFIRHGNSDDVAKGEGIKVHANENEHKIEVIKKFLGDENFYGFGEKPGHLNKKGCYYEMWNTDDPSPHVEYHKSLYKSIPFFITLRDKKAYGIFFDNTYRTFFDMLKENSEYYYFGADDGNLDYYFIYGPEVKEVLSGYTSITGRVPLPQMWTLGYQQCRWSYSPESRVNYIAEEFRKRDIPCDTIYLDIDYMDGYRVFTWDKERFTNPIQFTKRLKDAGFKIVTIIDPGVKKDVGYNIYDEGIKNEYFATKNGDVYENEVWPGESVYPDFSSEDTRKWWSNNQKIMLDNGVAGIWNDMNEPASFKGPLPDDVEFKNDGRKTNHLEIHNVYGHLMCKATYEGLKKYTNKRPFVVTRACYAGTQKYSTVWTGDNHSFWEHLRMSVPMLMNLGLSGFAFCGTDVGGFQFDCTAELLSRWVQVGCFTPLFRNHACIDTRDQEPWAFDEGTEAINRKYIKLRYKLMPYLYDIMKNSENTGYPVMRPLLMEFQDDENTYNINDQFLFGDNIMVAPILLQGQIVRTVYLPKGKWIDYWTGEEFEGNNYIMKNAPIDVCPMYIKKGSIIPNYPVQNYIGEIEIDELILKVYPGNGEYIHYRDDGESFEYRDGKYNLYKFSQEQNNDNLKVNLEMLNKGYEKDYKKFKLLINKSNVKEIKVNNQSYEFEVEENVIIVILENSLKNENIAIEIK